MYLGLNHLLNLTQNKSRKLKLKYTCPECKINVWGKPELNLMCSDCKCPLNPNIYIHLHVVISNYVNLNI